MGDVDLNGVVELADVTTLSKYLLSPASNPLAGEAAFLNADVTHDNKVDVVDLSKLIEYNMGRIPLSEL